VLYPNVRNNIGGDIPIDVPTNQNIGGDVSPASPAALTPVGAVLDPVLLLIFLNDLEAGVSSTVYKVLYIRSISQTVHPPPSVVISQ